MKSKIKALWLCAAAACGILVWFISENIATGVAVFSVLVTPLILYVYIGYAKHNPQQVWFKRKLYGWGWTPVTWQGWLVTLVYVGLIAAFALTIDERSSASEVAFTFGLPFVLLTIGFIRIAYKKGESPRWQWGQREDKDS